MLRAGPCACARGLGRTPWPGAGAAPRPSGVSGVCPDVRHTIAMATDSSGSPRGPVVSMDGVIMSPSEAVVSVFDRGFLYGDSVFEVMRSYGGRLFGETQHLTRLGASAARVLLPMPVSIEVLRDEVHAAVAESGLAEAYVRIVVTRGTGPLSLDIGSAEAPRRVIMVGEVPHYPKALYDEGVAVFCVRASRPTDHSRAAGAKASNYLANLLATHEAKQQGGHEAILVGPSGEVLEGATSNIFVVDDRGLCTPPVTSGILAGITRAAVLEAARRRGLSVHETSLFPKDLYEADEVFITSSIREVIPVVSVDQRVVGKGQPGPQTKALHRAYLDLCAEGDDWLGEPSGETSS